MEIDDEDIVPSSSGEEYLDLELEYPSAEDLSSNPSPSASPIRRYEEKKELGKSLKQFIIEDSREQSDEDEKRTFTVVGQINNQPAKRRTITASWVENANKFPSNLAETTDLLPLEGLRLKHEFIPVLRKFIKFWFPVQKSILPILLCEQNSLLPPRDVVISSPTGSGKTLCYLLPILNNLRIREDDAFAVFALIIVPVRNLGEQIFKEFAKFNVFGAKIVSLLGNDNYAAERSALFPNGISTSQAHIIIATPGSLIEHLLDDRGFLNLTVLRYLVVDEADRMQNTARLEWLELVEKHTNAHNNNVLNLASLTDPSRNRWLQRILVSATLSLDVHKLHTWNLRCPQLFQAANELKKTESAQLDSIPEQTTIILPDTLAHRVFQCQRNVKPYNLFLQLRANHSKWNRIIVFVNQRDTGSRLATLLSRLCERKLKNFVISEFSGSLFQKKRIKLLKAFRSGKVNAIITTDILSRGMDIEDVDCVVNYDVPINERIFAHRAGRTARAMKTGLLLSLVTKEEKMRLKKLLTSQNLWDNVEVEKIEENLDEKAMEEYRKALECLENATKSNISR